MFILAYLIMLILSANSVVIPGLVSAIITISAVVEGLIYAVVIVAGIIGAIRDR